ncbi:MAG: VTT domain-containing protein [Clostridiales Family XIII bacterium]|nr:VTT domain-containing protein [Clostridiales Family XIII bacterium]
MTKTNTDHGNSGKKKTRILISVLKFLVLLGIVAVVPLIVYLHYPNVLEDFNSLEEVNEMLEQYRTAGIFIYMGFQVVQVVISVIPGQPLQFAAGYAFGIFLGFASSIIGIGLATLVTYLLGKVFGKDMVYLVFGEKRLERFLGLMASKKALIIVFLLYLIPGIPKDIFSYAAGISNLRMMPFLALSLAGRAPALLCSIIIGRMFRTHSYVGMIVVAIIVLAAAGVAVLHRRRINAFIDRMHEKAMKKGH